MELMTQLQPKFFKSTAKICGLLSITLICSYNNALAKTVAITCPTVKTTLTSGYKTTEKGYEWQSWQSKPNLEVSTANDKNYFAEMCQSHKGISLRCVSGFGDKSYGFYTHSSKISSCKIDPNTDKGFICEVNE